MDKSLIVAALVAIVAVGGLVVFSQNNAVGQVIVISPANPAYRSSAPVAGVEDYQTGEQIGEIIAERCLKQEVSQQQCCSEQCTPGAVSLDMFRGCSYVCQLRVAQMSSQHIDLV